MNEELKSESRTESLGRAPEEKPASPRAALVGLGMVLLVACVLAGAGILGRLHSSHVLAQQTTALAPPTVSVAPPRSGSPLDSFVLPGNVTAYTDAPVYARVNGYLTRWYYDIGAHVQKGALLATISAPEVDQELAQAQADLETAETNSKNAGIQAQRYSDLVKSNAVSRLDTDTLVTQAAAAASAVRSAQANVQRLRAMQSFEKVYAPFTGIITSRGVDTGQLITQGSGAELFHMQAVQTLRVYANVPQLYSNNIRRGMKITLTFPEFPGKVFEGTLVRTANAIDPVNRTLLVEIDVENRGGKLLPGALAQVHFRAVPVAATFVVPSATLIFRQEGLQVGTVVNGSGGPVAHLVPVTIGQDDGSTVQIVSGLKNGDRVIQDPPDSLIEGERVKVVSPDQDGAGGF